MSALAFAQDFFGFRRDDYAERQLVERQEESRRIANDPASMGDYAVKAIRRHDALTIAELEAAKERARAEVEMYCMEIDNLIIALQERSGPLLEGINAHTSNMAAVREFLNQCR